MPIILIISHIIGELVSYTPRIRYMRIQNMRIRSYATNLNVPSIRFMQEEFAIMRVVALVRAVSEVWWPTHTRGRLVQMFSRIFLAYNFNLFLPLISLNYRLLACFPETISSNRFSPSLHSSPTAHAPPANDYKFLFFVCLRCIFILCFTVYIYCCALLLLECFIILKRCQNKYLVFENGSWNITPNN